MKVTWIKETANRNGSGGNLDVLQWGLEIGLEGRFRGGEGKRKQW